MMEGKGEGKGGGEEDGNGGGKEKRETMGEMEKKVREDGRMRFGLGLAFWGGNGKWEMELELELELGGDRNSDARWASQAGAEVAEEVRSAAVGKKSTNASPGRPTSIVSLPLCSNINYSDY